jgi:hypothetical protein
MIMEIIVDFMIRASFGYTGSDTVFLAKIGALGPDLCDFHQLNRETRAGTALACDRQATCHAAAFAVKIPRFLRMFPSGRKQT